jgi:hypothetical protein
MKMPMRLPFLLLFLLLSSCRLFNVSNTDGHDTEYPIREGQLITDSIVVIDDFPFSEEACAELVPENFANRSLPSGGRVPKLIVNSTACYSAKVLVMNDTGAPVDSFYQVFGIWGQKNGDKERGHLGYLIWSSSDSIFSLPRQTYTWKITFDYGRSQSLKLVALVDWPLD